MYKFKIDENLYTYFEPKDKNLAKSITAEVTNNRDSDEKGFVEVNEEERDKIQLLYAERNNDPKPIKVENYSKETVEELKNKIKTLETQQSLALAEVFEKQEADRLELMKAVAEVFETAIGGIE